MKVLSSALSTLFLLTVGLGLESWGDETPVWAPPHEGRPCYVIAHRGAHTKAPENTLPAYQRAIGLKLDYCEIDIRTSKDGHLVISHNSTVDSKTNGSGKVKDLLWADLRKLDAGSWFSPKFAGTHMPDFEAVLRLVKGKIGLYLDVKQADTQAVVDLLKKYDMVNNVVVYAYGGQLDEFARVAPSIKIMPDPGPAVNTTKILQKYHPRVIAPVWKWFTKEMVQKAHAAGAKVFVDTLGAGDNRKGMNLALDWGVDGIQTDRPEFLLKVIDKRAKP